MDIDHRSDCVNGSLGLVASCTSIEASSEVVDPSSDVVDDPRIFDKCPSIGLQAVSDSRLDSGVGACMAGADSPWPESSDAVDETGLGGKRSFHNGRYVNIDCQSACVNVCFGLDAPCTSIDSWSESDGGYTANDPPSCSDVEGNHRSESDGPICDACVRPNGSPSS